MKGKLRRILYVWGYYRLPTLFLVMIVLLAFAAFVCSSLNGVCFRMDPQPKSAKERMAILTGRLHLTFEQQIQIRPEWGGGGLTRSLQESSKVKSRLDPRLLR